jgi:hypothetical protein
MARVRLFATVSACLIAASAAVSSAQASPAGTAATPAGPAATGVRTQTARLHGSFSTFPVSARHSNGGAVNVTEQFGMKKFGNVSKSPRPATTRTSNGQVVMRNAASSAWVPTVKPLAVSANKPNAVAAWEGLNENDNQTFAGFNLEPPDQGLCAGNGYVFELINSVVRVYHSSGSPATPVVYLNDFFQEPGYQFTTDPSCVYDAGSNRFFATELTLDVDQNTGGLTGNNWLDLAVSKTGNPAGGWNVYRINVTDDGSNGTPSHSGCPCIGDYPHLGTNAQGVFLTTNEYPFDDSPGVYGNNFNGAQIYALRKSALVNGNPNVTVVHFENTRFPSTSGPLYVGFTIRPALAAGKAYPTANNGTMYFTSSTAAEEARPSDFNGNSNRIGVWWIQNTASLNGATPNLKLAVTTLRVPSYGIPPLSNQKPGPVPLRDCLTVRCRDALHSDPYAPEQEGGLDSSDTRILTAMYTSGTLHTALDTAMIVSGNVHAGAEWFVINANGSNSSLRKAGYAGVANGNVTYPAIATNLNGVGYVGMTLAGNYWFPSAVYVPWSNGMGSTTFIGGPGKAPEDGFCEYLYFNCAGTPSPGIRPRWGDYGYAAWDGSKFYLANEYIAHSCTFTQFNNDTTCGGTRTFYGNFSTHIQVLH